MGVRGAAPSMAGGPAAPFNGSGTAARPRSSSKSIAPNRESLVFRMNSGSTDEPLMRGSFFCGERGGDRSIGEANLRKGAALQWLAHLAPVRGASPFNGSGTAVPFIGSGTAVPFNGSGTAVPFNGSGPAVPFNRSGLAAPWRLAKPMCLDCIFLLEGWKKLKNSLAYIFNISELF